MPDRMTADEYRHALARVGLTPYSQRTARLLGITPRSSGRYATGRFPVAATVAANLRMMVLLDAAGVPPTRVEALLGGIPEGVIKLTAIPD